MAMLFSLKSAFHPLMTDFSSKPCKKAKTLRPEFNIYRMREMTQLESDFDAANTQIATLIAVSPASVSLQKFRLKKRMIQADGRLFADGETLEGVIGSC